VGLGWVGEARAGDVSEAAEARKSSFAARWAFSGERFWKRAAVASVGALALLVGLIVARSIRTGQAPVAAGAAMAAASIPQGVPAPSAAADAEKVRLVVRATPSGARILVDRQLVRENPVSLLLPRDGATHSVRVEADGYAPRDDTFSATADRTWLVALELRKPAFAHFPPSRYAAPAPVAPTPAAPSPAAAASANSPLQRRINAANPYAE